MADRRTICARLWLISAGPPRWSGVGQRLFRTLLALFVASAFAGASLAAGPEMQKLQLEVFIDGASTNLVAEILRAPDGRFAARRSELREVGVAVPGSGKDDDVIAFESIPGFGMRYDEPNQKLHLTLAPESRLAKEYSATRANGMVLKPEISVSREYGSVLNYNLFGTAARGYSSGSRMFTTGSATLDHRFFSPFGVVQNSAIVGTTLTREGILRLESAYSYAHHETSTLLTAGDSISGGLSWTRPSAMAASRSAAIRSAAGPDHRPVAKCFRQCCRAIHGRCLCRQHAHREPGRGRRALPHLWPAGAG